MKHKLLAGLLVALGLLMGLWASSFVPKNEVLGVNQIESQITNEFFAEKLLDLTWKKTFHYLTLFDSLDGFDQVFSGSGTIAYPGSTDTSNVILTTGATSTNATTLRKVSTFNGLPTFSQRSFMRASFVATATTSQTAYVKVGLYDGEGYGFKIVDDKIWGTTHNGSTESTSTVSFQTISANTAYQLEARYLPERNVVFLINGTERGAMQNTLPSSSLVANPTIMTFRIETATNSARSIKTSHYEYLQYRDVLD